MGVDNPSPHIIRKWWGDDFTEMFERIQGSAFGLMKANGFHDKPDTDESFDFPARIALAHYVLSSAMDKVLKGEWKDDNETCNAIRTAIAFTIDQDINVLDDRKADFARLALMHCEVSEAVIGYTRPSEKIPGFSCEEEELADVILRIMDYAGLKKLRIAEAVVAKHNHNCSRPYRHGGCKF